MLYLSPQQILSIKKVDFQRGISKTITMHIQSIVQIFSIYLRSPAFCRRAHFAFLPALLPLRQTQGRAHRENGCTHPFCVYGVRFLLRGALGLEVGLRFPPWRKLMCDKVTHKNLKDIRPLFRFYCIYCRYTILQYGRYHFLTIPAICFNPMLQHHCNAAFKGNGII